MLSLLTHRDDVELELELIRHAQLLTEPQNPVGDAVAELRRMANGRADLLARAAEAQMNAYLASPRTMNPYLLLAGTLLVLASADDNAVGHGTRVRVRRMAPGAA
jgi:hypothetical protein